MLPLLAYPLALVALASLPVLAAIYFFRHRFRRRTVSSLLLWRFRVRSKEGGTKVQRLQLPLLFFLELLALSLLVAAASGPQWRQLHSDRPLIVVLDDSFSMRAMHENSTAQERARGFLKELFARQPPPFTRLLLAGSEPRLAGAQIRTWSELNEILAGWTCHAPRAALDAAITLAAELGEQQANLLVLTDQPPPDERVAGPRLQWRAFGQPVANLAIVNASRTSHVDQDRCLLEIANYSRSSRVPRLVVQTGSNTLESASAAIAPNERQRLVFNIPADATVLQATLEADGLGEDNAVQLLPPMRRRVRVQVALTNTAAAELVDRTLETTGLRSRISADPELVIHQSDLPHSGSNTWNLRWLIPAETNVAALAGPFVIDTSHPLAEGMALHGVVWAASTTLSNAPGAVPVILAGNTPLLLAQQDALGRRQFTLNLDPALSTVHNTPDWPVFFWNLLQWRALEQPGLTENNVRIGADVGLQTAGQAVKVSWPDGAEKSFLETGDRLILETPLPGRYTVELGTITNVFVVNSLAAEESSLMTCSTGRWGAWEDESERRIQVASAVWVFGLAALAMMTVHLVLLAPRKRNST